jgi:hypothetical protein
VLNESKTADGVNGLELGQCCVPATHVLFREGDTLRYANLLAFVQYGSCNHPPRVNRNQSGRARTLSLPPSTTGLLTVVRTSHSLADLGRCDACLPSGPLHNAPGFHGCCHGFALAGTVWRQHTSMVR